MTRPLTLSSQGRGLIPTWLPNLDSLPMNYEIFPNVLEKKNVDLLLEHRPNDCSINLQERTCPHFGSIYGLLELELEALRTFIEDNLKKGFIQSSKSLVGAAILFVKRNDT